MKNLYYKVAILIILLMGMNSNICAEVSLQVVTDDIDASLISIVKKYFPSDSIDIFISKEQFSKDDTLELMGVEKILLPFTCHVVFADLMPNANWGHDCEYLFVSSDEQQVSVIKQNMPPLHMSKIFDLYQQGVSKYGEIMSPRCSSNPFQVNTKNQIQNRQTSDLHKKYAVIISGGGDIDHNSIRYWNDCSAVYQTLLNNGYPASNIYVAMSDGTDPHNDMPNGPWSYMSSPLDLDGNQTNDIQYAATYDNIQLIFDSLAYKMTDNDDLFVFVTDHGGITSGHNNSYIVLWNNAILMDTAFAQMITPISARTINIVMEQCYSGGFIDDLRGMENVIITTACEANEVSYALLNGLYDEFIYFWLASINGYSPLSLYPNYAPGPLSIDADINDNGYITMDEAYISASSHDSADEHPQQESHPSCMAQSLSLSGLLDLCENLLVYGADLYMKDNIKDIGDEPNTTTTYSWITEDIWFEENGHRINQLTSGQSYDVCVRVRNRGNDTSSDNATLYVHWAKAQIGGSWPWGWTDDYPYDCAGTFVRRGELFGVKALPRIEAGGTYVARIPWTTPESDEYISCMEFAGDDLSELWHYCMLARIVDDDEQPDESITDISFREFVLNHNNVVSRNVTIMDVQNDSITEPHLTGIVGLTNPTVRDDSGPYRLICNIWGENNWNQYAIVRLTFANRFYENQTHHLTCLGCVDYDDYSRSFDLGSTAEFDSIYFSYNDAEFYPIKIDVIYLDSFDPNSYPEFTISLELQDINGTLIGGEWFQFRNAHPDLANSINTPAFQEWIPQPMTAATDDMQYVDVYNAQGQHIMRCTNAYLKTANLPRGVYILHVQSQNESLQLKIIK